ncbi:hypothetical protein D3C83_295830 [compost metagenome]
MCADVLRQYPQAGTVDGSERGLKRWQLLQAARQATQVARARGFQGDAGDDTFNVGNAAQQFAQVFMRP